MKEKCDNKHLFKLLAVGNFDGLHNLFINSLTYYCEDLSKTKIYLTENDSENVLLSNKEKIKVLNSYGIKEIEDFQSRESMNFIKQISQPNDHKYLQVLFDNKKLLEAFKREIPDISSSYNEEFNIQSEIIKNILQINGDAKEAAKLLGYYYFIHGRVVSGNKLGRKLGFPTANTEPENKNKLIPAKGVYAALINISNNWYKAMLNIGVRPTLNLEKLTIEAHLIDYRGDLYDQDLSIHFISRIRDEMKFANTDELSKQLETDKNTVISELNNLKADITDNGHFCKY
ncbi:MAG: riboflavin kinase [Bacteroidales bacterium]